MKSLSKILKKNRRQKLGRYNRELVIRLAIKKIQMTKPIYHLVLARTRSRAGSRYDKLGFYEIFKDERRSLNVLGLNQRKIKQALELGAIFHTSVYKLLFN
jgi:ribosomal protein S16